ncbi:MAG TPA: class II aldolase/adducin family protein [Dongiaceae bacterium]|nr:class II aldolase/adducin family protein [Dongiaceae bacterium]
MSGSASELEIRKSIVEVNAELERQRMNVCSTGNISVRWQDGMLITPAGSRTETLAPEHMVHTKLDGSWEGSLRPSSEWAMHLEVYRRIPAANAVVHCHADHSVALSCFRKPIPSFHYMIQGFGGQDIPCTDYYPFGSQELAAAAREALIDRTACLLANHGLLARGATLLAAYDAAMKLEVLARQYLMTLSIGTPMILTEAETAVVLENYKTYGKPQPTAQKPRWLVP